MILIFTQDRKGSNYTSILLTRPNRTESDLVYLVKLNWNLNTECLHKLLIFENLERYYSRNPPTATRLLRKLRMQINFVRSLYLWTALSPKCPTGGPASDRLTCFTQLLQGPIKDPHDGGPQLFIEVLIVYSPFGANFDT